MEKLFVPIEIAILLKQKGFNEPCMKGVKNNEEFTTCGFSLTNQGNTHDFILPLYQQVINWFKKRYGIILLPTYSYYYGIHYGYRWVKTNGESGEFWEQAVNAEKIYKFNEDSFEEATNYAIIETLKLIEVI
jgi:hypothetical protein